MRLHDNVLQMKIYTKTGDRGETALFGGARVMKDDARIDACGMVDELNAAIGAVRADAVDRDLDEILAGIQNRLFSIGADLGTPFTSGGVTRVAEQEATALEAVIDRLEAYLAPLREFILPGGSPAAAHIHLARTICRRAERAVVHLFRTEKVNPAIIVYLNRLSDLLFVAARTVNHRAHIPDTPWHE